MRAKPATTATAALMSRLADSIETEHDATAASLVRHLSTKVAENDLVAVVSFLSDALDLAKAEMHCARKTCTPVDEPYESDYWLG